jgi:hypothetical protein
VSLNLCGAILMKKYAGLFGVLLAISLSFVLAAHAAQLVAANSGECIDVPHGNTADGTPISLFQCHGSPNQLWTLSHGQITGIGGSCLDIMGSLATDGAQIIIVACNGRSSQNWSIAHGQIIGSGGKCIDTSGGATVDHTPLILASCSSAPSQQWSVQ